MAAADGGGAPNGRPLGGPLGEPLGSRVEDEEKIPVAAADDGTVKVGRPVEAACGRPLWGATLVLAVGGGGAANELESSRGSNTGDDIFNIGTPLDKLLGPE